MRIRYIIFDLRLKSEPALRSLIKQRIVSAVVIDDYVIMARYGVNKGTLRKMLRKHLS